MLYSIEQQRLIESLSIAQWRELAQNGEIGFTFESVHYTIKREINARGYTLRGYTLVNENGLWFYHMFTPFAQEVSKHRMLAVIPKLIGRLSAEEAREVLSGGISPIKTFWRENYQIRRVRPHGDFEIWAGSHEFCWYRNGSDVANQLVHHLERR